MSSISSLSGSNPALSFSGLSTGIDTNSLIDGLLALQQSKVTALQSQQANVTALQGTFNGLGSALGDLQSKVGTLARSVAGAFDGRKVVVSDDTALQAAAGTTAAPGQYTFKVTALAAAQQIASQGVADPSTSLRTGTLQLKVGGATTTVNVDSTNNTLQGLATAINNSGAAVQASVINDGSSTPYRLLLTSTKTGTANAIQVTNNLTGGTGASINLDPATQTIQQAADAQITLGSGASAITVTSASNTVDSVVPGVTLKLQSADPNKALTVTVSNDTDAASKAVSDFVTSYNAVID
jgi:flagellar hook-associated protein 2